MRIISGTHKGRSIPLPKNFKARPTTDFAKESLFNILNNHLNFEDLTALDLFSGTGSISYELASRGCEHITSVENSSQNHQLIKKIIESFKLNQIHAVKADVFSFLKTCKGQFDLIFADPPYEMEGIDLLPDIIFNKNILKTNGWFILEHSNKIDFTSHLKLFDNRLYGSVNFSFFRNLTDKS